MAHTQKLIIKLLIFITCNYLWKWIIPYALTDDFSLFVIQQFGVERETNKTRNFLIFPLIIRPLAIVKYAMHCVSHNINEFRFVSMHHRSEQKRIIVFAGTVKRQAVGALFFCTSLSHVFCPLFAFMKDNGRKNLSTKSFLYCC